MANFVVYSSETCTRCKQMKRAIKRAGHTVEEIDAPTHADEVLELGLGNQLPIVVPPAGYGEAFSGFRPDRIHKAPVEEPVLV